MFLLILPTLQKIFKRNSLVLNVESSLAARIPDFTNCVPFVTMPDEVVECNFRMIESYLPELLFLLSYNSRPKESIHSIINRLAGSGFPYADIQHSKHYLCHKIICLLEAMLFADIFGKVWNGAIEADKVYVYKDGTELRYYHYRQVRPFLCKLLENIVIKRVMIQDSHTTLNVQFHMIKGTGLIR